MQKNLAGLWVKKQSMSKQAIYQLHFEDKITTHFKGKFGKKIRIYSSKKCSLYSENIY